MRILKGTCKKLKSAQQLATKEDGQANARNGLIDGYFIECTFSSFEKKFDSFFGRLRFSSSFYSARRAGTRSLDLRNSVFAQHKRAR